MKEIVKISYTGQGIESQGYSTKDDLLITNSFIYTQFGDPNDVIEYFIYDQNGTLIDKNYNVTKYTPSPSVNPVSGLYSSITLDPKSDLEDNGYIRGNLNIQYNFTRNLFNSSYGKFFWIKEISLSRTELKLASQNLSNTEILDGFNQYQAYISSLNYYNDFYLNFGNNQHLIAVNVAYTEDDEGAYLLIKLYEPLPSNFDVKDQLWIVEKIAESANYNVDIQVEATSTSQQFALRGPNYNVKLNEKVGQTTPYYSYSSLITTPISSSFQKMMSYYQDRAININVDYSDFSNFIHFSSATSRIKNFVDKIANIEKYNSQINQQLSLAGGLTNPAVSSSVVNLKSLIDSITTNFDGYEYYLYYSSGSTSWPKSNSTQPYSLYSVTSSQATNWLGSETTIPSSTGLSILYSSSLYDATNKDLLTNIVPQFISDDENNEPYITFVNMIGQHFDNIWLYYKDVTNRFDATNNPSTGISPDLVADALINLGTTLYTNTNISDNLYYSLFGINPDGSLLPPTGSENITTYITSNLSTLPENNIRKEIYKRLYHNIPYLYKTKGTRAGIEALVNIFGIPKSILTINEFGGYDRSLIDGIDSIYNTKVTGSLSVLEISSSVLTPSTTLQYFDNKNRLNSKNVEFGFSPADELNSTITSSLGYFDIDQLIGNPNYQYSTSYPLLDQEKYNFFSSYNYYHNIYEYIRLLKYYDNSLFKMVQDYVPARTNLSTGLIVKSHILERNKYERHEPEIDISSNYSESIDLLTVSGTDPDEIPWSTENNTYSQFTIQPLSNHTGSDNIYGPIEIKNTYSWEKYTGEFGGSSLDVVTGTFSQLETSSMTNTGPFYISNCNRFIGTLSPGDYTGSYKDCNGVMQNVSISLFFTNSIEICSLNTSIILIQDPLGIPSSVPLTLSGKCTTSYEIPSLAYNEGALYNNITSSVTSNKFTEAEYSYGIDVPVNMSTIISESSCQNCNRINCINLIVSNTISDSVYSFTYQDCDNQTYLINLSGSQVAQICAKSNTLNFLYDSNNYLNVINNGLCGAAFSNYPYISNCRNVGITNISTNSFDVSYNDCTGSIQTKKVNPSFGVSLGCADPSSISVTSGILGDVSPSDYEISIGDYCTNPYSLSEYTKYCDFFEKYYLDSGGGPSSPWSFQYQRCSDGLVVSASGMTPGGPIAQQVMEQQCIRSGSLITSGDVFPQIITGSLKYCGYYENPTPYTGSKTSVEIQEYNYHRLSSIRSRYEGAKSISSKYNVYTPGDNSYPGYAAADNYVGYTGLFTNVESSSYFPDQMVVKLSYLSDISGGLNDLNLQNNNWVYVQNIYKPNSTITVKQFNANQYSNQNYLDKQFQVVESGYSYQPYWYRSNSDTTECYRVPYGSISNIISSSYSSIAYSGDLNLNWLYPPTASDSYRSNFPFIPSGSSESDDPYTPHTYQLSLFRSNSAGYIKKNDLNGNLIGYKYYSSSWNPNHKYITGSYYNVPNPGEYIIKSYLSGDIYSITSTATNIKISIVKNPITASGYIDGGIILGTGSFTRTPIGGRLNNFNVTASYTGILNKNDRIFTKVEISQWERLPSISTINISTYSQSYELASSDGTTCISIPSSSLFSSSYIAGDNILPLTKNMSSLFDINAVYLPNELFGSSSLYPLLGDINYNTEIEIGDYIIFYYNGLDISIGLNDIYPISRRVIDITDNGSEKSIEVYPNMPPYITAANINLYKKIVFVKRQPDESVVILQGKKRAGKTSYGFLVPQDIDPYILKNINTLQSTIQSQILNY